MQVKTYPLGTIQANCFVVWNNNHALIVDPGGSSKKIIKQIEEANGIVDGIVLTHGHFDHIQGVDFFAKQFKCPVYISEQEERFLHDPARNCSSNHGEDVIVKHETLTFDTNMHVGAFDFSVMEAPGHTNGSVLILFEKEHLMFAGDVLFKGSIGRCDLPTGSTSKMQATLESIKALSPEYIVYPGHGPSTTLQDELVNNPYLQ